MSASPYISVLMSVYNAEKFVGDCIRSILGQTFTDFEFIIINDASTDSSLEIIKSFIDKRIRLLNNRERSYPTRNKGLRVAKGKYICIMDADDISLPLRFERQVLFMDNNPEIGLAGSGYQVLGLKKDLYRESDYEKIKVQLMRNNCFIHPSVIIRHDLLKKHKLRYIRKYYYSSDYDFIARAARCFPVTNIHEVLMHYRVHEGQVTIQYRKTQAKLADEISINQLRFIGLNPDKNEVKLHTALLKGQLIEYSSKHKIHEWIQKIKEANRQSDFYSENELDEFLQSLLSLQPFCNGNLGKSNSKRVNDEKQKYDLMDVTFVMPVRITSDNAIENLDITIEFLAKHFNTNIIILEADREQRYYPVKNNAYLKYIFIEDNTRILHRTKRINQLISMARTHYVAVLDADAISPPEQILKAVEVLRSEQVIMSFPYDGRYFLSDQITCDVFKRILDIEILNKHISAMHLIKGYHCYGGSFIVSKEKYINAGGENENIYGSEFVGDERVKRLEIMGLPVFYAEGPLLGLWHPKRKSSQLTNSIGIHDRRELIDTCKTSANKILLECSH